MQTYYISARPLTDDPRFFSGDRGPTHHTTIDADSYESAISNASGLFGTSYEVEAYEEDEIDPSDW